MTNRREFLASSAVGIATSAGGRSAFAASGVDAGPILDTHQHLWDLEILNPPWVKEADEILRNKYDSAAYARESVGLNIVSCLYMEIDMAPDKVDVEAKYILDLCRSGKTPTRGAILSGRPEEPAFVRRVKRLSKADEVRGFRRILHVDHAPPQTCLGKQFEKSMSVLADNGRTFDLCMRVEELDDGAKLAGRCADTQFIVDHCGNADPVAFQQKGQQKREPLHDAGAWRRSMERFASHDNVACKISGIVARAPEGWRSEHLAPIIDFCLQTFGPDRVLFGSDWPVCRLGGTLKQWVVALREIVSERPEAHQRALFSQNAQKIYGAKLQA
ncbi:MAG: amidohydrolase family protein [Pirellulaceae bacterium]